MSDRIKVAVFGTDPQTRNQYFLVAIAAAFRSHSDVAEARILTYANVVRSCAEGSIDLLLVVGGAGAIIEPLYRATKHVGISVLWTMEDPYELDRNLQLASIFDIVFTNDINALASYPIKARHLPFAASDIFHSLPVLHDPNSFLFDLFFVGTAWPERVDALNLLLSKLKPGIRKKIGLSGNPHLPNFHLGDLDLITNFRLAPREFARMANSSLVSLTLDRSFSNNNETNVEGGTPPPRLFELALAGTAQIYVTGRTNTSKYFVPNEEIVIVDCMEAAAEAIHQLTERPEERKALATKARERALKDHLYSNRVEVILAAAASLTQPRTGAVAASNKKRKRILLVSHNVAGITPFGGVELYQQTQTEVLSAHDFYVLYPDRISERLHLKEMSDGTSTSINAGPIRSTKISDPLREEILGEIIQRHNFDLVHYNHLIGHPLSLPLISYAFGVPSVFQVHDYYALCHEFTLIGYKRNYCNVQDSRVESCDICLSTRSVAPPGAQNQRRWVMANALGRIDAFVHNSEYTKRKFTEIYPDLDMNLHHVIGNTARRKTLTDLFEIAGKRDRNKRRSGRLQVAILGNFTHAKGGDLLIAMFWQMTKDPIDIHIIGRVDADLASVLLKAAFANVKIHGEFDQSNLALELREMDVSVHFSIWPETYCLSLDEARAAGLVPIVLGYGALAERVQNDINGIVIDKDRPFDLIKVLRSLCVNREKLEALVFYQSTLEQGHDKHFEALERIYQNLFSRYPVVGPPNLSAKSRPLHFSDLGQRFNSDEWTRIGVTYDVNLSADDSTAVEIARKERATPPRVISDEILAERWLRPGDETISLILDEVTNSIANKKIIFIPSLKTSIAFGVGVPFSLDRTPFEVLLLGERSYRWPFMTPRRLVDDRSWTVCRLDLKNVESGLYSIVIGLRAGSYTFRYGAGAQVSIKPNNEPVWREQNQFYSEPWQVTFDPPRPNNVAGTDPRDRARRLIKKLQTNLGVGVPPKTKEGIIAFIDTIGGVRPKGRNAIKLQRAQCAGLQIVGWSVPRTLDAPFEAVFLRLLGEKSVVAATAALVERPDISTHFQKNELRRSGIEWACPVQNLELGLYRIEVTGVDVSGSMHSTLAAELIIE